MTPPPSQVEIRLRSLGEILDDAWQLYRLDLAPLSFLTNLFTVPWAVACLWTLTRPAEADFLWPSITAALLLLSGLGPGACQELLRQRSVGRRPRVLACLWASLKRGIHHMALRGLALPVLWGGAITLIMSLDGMKLPLAAKVMIGFFGFFVLVVPGLLMWLTTISGHAIIAAGARDFLEAYRVSRREVWRQAGKAVGLLVSRVLLLAMVALNLFVLVAIALWVTESFLGFDVAFMGRFTELDNPAYVVGLMLAAFLVLAPYLEVLNYLFHIDARTRYEGLDLWYRVQRLFPSAPAVQPVVVAASIALLLVFLFSLLTPACAADRPTELKAVQELQQELRQMKTEPFPGAERWAARLPAMAKRAVARGAPTIVEDWFTDTAKTFRYREEAGARQVLDQLDQRLTALEQSLTPPAKRPSKERVKSLAGAKSTDDEPEPPPPPPPTKPDKPPENTAPDKEVSRVQSVEAPSGGLGGIGVAFPWHLFAWALLGIVVLVVIFAIVRVLMTIQWPKRTPKPNVVNPEGTPIHDEMEKLLSEPPRSSAELWKDADELARQGKLLEAVRKLYIAVLVLLHQAGLIRYERTRTNGEYVRQLRRQADLQSPFRQLTSVFDWKWYGERHCAAEDYQSCRTLAEQLYEDSRQHG